MDENRRKRKEILKLEKQMQKNPGQQVVLSLAEKYAEIGEAHQAVAVLIEGIQSNPDNATLKVVCARYMLIYQTDEVTKAENLIKHVLMEHPDNLMAQQLMEQIHTQVDTMHEVAAPFDFDTSELQQQATMKFNAPPAGRSHGGQSGGQTTGTGNASSSEDVQAEGSSIGSLEDDPYYDLLSRAFELFHESRLDQALEIIQRILEEDPENPHAREGFRLIYAEKYKIQEESKIDTRMEKKLEVIRRTVRFMEAMRTVVRSR